MDKQKTVEEKENVAPVENNELLQEDQFAIQRLLAENLARRKCKQEIDIILKKYGATLMVNPDSPISNPQIIIVLKN
jgi:hypothetical protein